MRTEIALALRSRHRVPYDDDAYLKGSRGLEYFLYFQAASLEEYTDKTTIKTRIGQFAQMCNKFKTPIVPSSPLLTLPASTNRFDARIQKAAALLACDKGDFSLPRRNFEIILPIKIFRRERVQAVLCFEGQDKQVNGTLLVMRYVEEKPTEEIIKVRYVEYIHEERPIQWLLEFLCRALTDIKNLEYTTHVEEQPKSNNWSLAEMELASVFGRQVVYGAK